MQSIPVKEAVRLAKLSLADLYQDDPPQSLALEEIELVNNRHRALWAVTLGFHRPKSMSVVSGGLSALGLPMPPVEHRVYKTVFIDASTGDFVKMDIRQVQ